MAITFDGSTGYLEHSASIVTSYPCSMVVWGTRANSNGNQFWVAQQQSNASRYISGWHLDSSDTKYISAQIVGNGDSQPKSTAPHTSTTALKMMVVVFASASSKTIYFGDNAGVNNTVTIADELVNHDRCTVGALHFNGGVASNFANGALAEAHWFNTALTSVQIDALLADTTKPEDTTGWVDGWTLKDFETGGTYTSIGGTRTMTAVGGVTASALTHPIGRSSPDASAPGATLTGASTITPGSASGDSPGVAPGATLTGTATIIGGAATGGGSGGTLVTYPFVNNTNDPVLYANQTGVTVDIYNNTTGALVVRKTGQTTNASGIATITDAAMSDVTTYRYWATFADGEFGADTKAT